MSGGEVVVGLVLGVLPLIIRAVESYEKIGDVLATYRKYAKAVHIFSIELSTQQTIFQNECIWLLAEVVDDQWLLHEMFSESAGAARLSLKNNWNLERKLLEHMNGRTHNSYKQLVALLDLIAQNLEEIYEDIKQYQSTRPDVGANTVYQACCAPNLTSLSHPTERINPFQSLGTGRSYEVSLLD